MNFEEANKHLKGVPHIGEEQARGLHQFVLRQQPKRRQGIYAAIAVPLTSLAILLTGFTGAGQVRCSRRSTIRGSQ